MRSTLLRLKSAKKKACKSTKKRSNSPRSTQIR